MVKNEDDWDRVARQSTNGFTGKLVFPKDFPKEVKEFIQSNAKLYKDIVNKRILPLFVSDLDNYYEDAKSSYTVLKALYNLVYDIDTEYKKRKIELNSFTFSDIQHYAIDLLLKLNGDAIELTPIAENLRSTFKEILVDEYQDTNEAQDILFKYLSNGKNLFVVGDIKQSIYRFRLAMPNIFNQKRKDYTLYDPNDDSISSKIILDKNFRSRKDICSYVNFLFSLIMSEKVGEINYDELEYLYYNENSDYPSSNVPSAQIKIVTGFETEDRDYQEGLVIAKTIVDKISNEELITDNGKQRPVRYSDFAILVRAKDRAIDIIKALNEKGIPTISEASTNLFDNNEIKIIISYLRAINNPTFEISLVATMTSAIYGFTDDELAQIRVNSQYGSFYNALINSTDEKVISFLKDLRDLRSISVSMSVASFIRYIVESKGIASFANIYGNGEQRYKNILSLINLAEAFDNGANVGLTAFLRYIDSAMKTGTSISSSVNSNGTNNAVNIMTIHKSKGLEFPIVIHAGASRDYNYEDLKGSFQFNSNCGMGFKRIDIDRHCIYNTIPREIIKNKNRYELISENLRVLYVAMTRAKEQYITIISDNSIDKRIDKLAKKVEDGYIHPISVYETLKDSDFILMAALLHKNRDQIRSLVTDTLPSPMANNYDLSVEYYDAESLEQDDEKIELAPYDDTLIEQIKEKAEYKYERLQLSELSAKLTASSLDRSDNGYDFIASSKPAFLSTGGMTAAEKGTAMHKFMQVCDYKNAACDIEQEIADTVKNGELTEEQAKSLNRAALNSFFKSELAARMVKSKNLYREIEVLTYEKASNIFDTDFDDDVLIQGVADCVFEEDGELVLVDYKTDRVDSEAILLDRYNKQISFYKNAISKKLGKKVKQTCLYSFALGKICEYK